jgi:anti-anti-sigma factor
MSVSQPSEEHVTIERHGDVTILVPAPSLEAVDPGLVEQAAALMLAPLRNDSMPLIVVDLSKIDFFGSTFLSVLLRCWKQAQAKGGLMVVSGVSSRARELLRVTSLDMVWPIYDSRREAIEALEAD